MTGSEEGNDARELSDSVGERAGQLLAEITSRRSGAGGRAKAIGLGKEAILAVFKFGMELSGDQVAEQAGREGQGAGVGSQADSWGPHQQVLGCAVDSGR